MLLVVAVCLFFKIIESFLIDRREGKKKKKLKRWMKAEFQRTDELGSLGIADRKDRCQDKNKSEQKKQFTLESKIAIWNRVKKEEKGRGAVAESSRKERRYERP